MRRDIFDRQLKFGLAHRLREPDMKVTQVGEAFAAFFDVEYGDGIAQETINAAWKDVECALTNLARMQDLQSRLLSATQLISQRSLTFIHRGDQGTGSAVFIAFFSRSATPHHRLEGTYLRISRLPLKLALYALALTNCKPHKDFPNCSLLTR